MVEQVRVIDPQQHRPARGRGPEDPARLSTSRLARAAKRLVGELADERGLDVTEMKLLAVEPQRLDELHPEPARRAPDRTRLARAAPPGDRNEEFRPGRGLYQVSGPDGVRGREVVRPPWIGIDPEMLS